MDQILHPSMAAQREQVIIDTFQAERKRLLDFITRRLPSREDAEDVMQDVFYQFTEAYSAAGDIQRVTGWLYKVARNRITDWYRKKRPDSFSKLARPSTGDEDEGLRFEDILPDLSSDPEQEFMRSLIRTAIEDALLELPEEQREVFVRHELEGQSFKEMEAELGVTLNTLLSRKRYAVLALREKLDELYRNI